MQKDTTAPIFKPYWLGERSPAEPVILEPENTWKTTPASGIARSKSDWSLAIPLSPVIGLGVGVYSVLANEIQERLSGAVFEADQKRWSRRVCPHFSQVPPEILSRLDVELSAFI